MMFVLCVFSVPGVDMNRFMLVRKEINVVADAKICLFYNIIIQ